MHRYLLLILITLTLESYSVTYTHNEINSMVYTELNEKSAKEFIRGFFISKDPESYIGDYVSTHKNRIEPIYIEYKFYLLLREISSHSKQPYLQKFITKMKNYEAKAMVLHDEGRVPVAIYNLKAKAQGIENIWLAADSLNYYVHLFEKDALSALSELKKELNRLKTPQWLGLKNSIKSISPDNHVLITDYLLNNPKNLTNLDKFISHYALFTGNKQLIQLALKHLDQSNSEYLLRKLKEYFDEKFVVDQLINTAKSSKNQAFAISMMSPYLVNERVQDTLLKSIESKELSSQSALVLTQTKNKNILQKLENIYNRKNVSEDVQKQIIFVMKMNKLKQSDVILSRLLDSKAGSAKSVQWLNSFKGEVK